MGRPRLLTTNFDTLFERAAQQAGVALMSHAHKSIPRPGGPRDYGILHLHGRLADDTLNLEGSDLILTSADFGEPIMALAVLFGVDRDIDPVSVFVIKPG